MTRRPLFRFTQLFKWAVWSVATFVLIFGIWRLEAERATVSERVFSDESGMISIYEGAATRGGPLVVVTHGFAGSRQMMQYISRDLARAGFTVAAFDFYGQGRSIDRMSADVSRIEGTTQQLVDQTQRVVRAVQNETGLIGPVALVGHSMATDVIIRAAADLPDVAAIVAISMYSDAVTPQFPPALLILSGAWEERLRRVALEAIAQVGGTATEGVTVAKPGVVRRAVSVPNTEHVGVLFAPVTMEETRSWLHRALDMPPAGETWQQGQFILAVLAAIVVLFWPVAGLLPKRAECAKSLRLLPFLAALAFPAAGAGAATLVFGGAVFGTAAFGSLIVFFFVWGAVALGILWWLGRTVHMPDLRATLLLLIWSLGLFALALDRYGAAFIPVGPRVELMAALAPGTVLFMLADRLLLWGAPIWQRLIARVAPIVVLSLCMMLHPANMGLLFTVLPVMVLFYLVFGTMARAVVLRGGAAAGGVALGIILAWSISASTPLFWG